MRRLALVLALAAGVAVWTSRAQARCIDPDLETVRDRILVECQCTGEGNHGRYVSCVSRTVRDAVRSGELDTNCKGKVVRCAARSTCGKKAGFVTCTLCVPGTCTEGLCDDGVTLCTDSAQCPQVVDRCSTKSSAERCLARGGVVGTGSCCHASCGP